MNILILDGKNQSLEQLAVLLNKETFNTVYLDDPLVAISTLKKQKIDVLISAIDIKKTTILNLFKALTIKFQSTVRIAITTKDQNEASQVSNLANISHYIFDPTTTFQQVADTIKAFEHANKEITKNVIVKAVSSVKTLPSPPKVYLQLNAILKNKNSDSDKIAEIISQSPALAAKVLQFSNSSFMPNGKKLTNITDAITKMGVEAVSCIVMTAEMFAYQPDIPNFSIEEEQLHSIKVARFAATLVDPSLKHDALLSGLLHDIGKLVLFEIDKALTLKYFENRARTKDDILLEQKIFTTDHCRIGGYLLHLWSFPYHIVEAILQHHNPQKLLTGKFEISQAIYVANSLLTEQELAPQFIEHFKLTNTLEALQKKAARFA